MPAMFSLCRTLAWLSALVLLLIIDPLNASSPSLANSQTATGSSSLESAVNGDAPATHSNSLVNSLPGHGRSGYLIWRNFARQPHLYSPPFLQQLHNVAFRTSGFRPSSQSDRLMKPVLRSPFDNSVSLYAMDSNRKHVIDSNGLASSSALISADEDDAESLIPFDDFDDMPSMPKRDSDYGHMRFGRAPSDRIAKRPLGKKIESDYGHFRFG